MNEFMKTLLSLSVSGTLLLLLIWGAKALYRNTFSRSWQYYIWLIAALRFLLPFTPDAALVGSLFETTDRAETVNEIPVNPSAPVSAGTDGSGTDPAWADRFLTDFSIGKTVPVYGCLFFLWAVPALLLLVRKITVYQSFIRYLKAGNAEVSDLKTLNLLSDCEEKLNCKIKVELSCNPMVASPMQTGFFRPGIVLPACELGEKALSYIFVHELIHCRRKDIFYKWLIQIVVCVHWFNPFVYLLEKEVNRACELSCDEKALSLFGAEARHEYGDTLISLLKPDKFCKSSFASVTLTEGAKQLKERLGAIMKFRKKSKGVTVATSVFTAAVCVCFFVTGAYAAPSGANENKIWKDSRILNEELTEDGVYYIFCDGAGEEHKPRASVSAGSVKFVLVRKDGWTSIGPFDNMETLMEDVAEQCEYMKNLTEEEKKSIMETAADIYENKGGKKDTPPPFPRPIYRP